ncbi:MAG: V-type ATP synthase subunit A, partial [Planctomycetes bacterium]|nr:V-type ATP synthase subunit A [Planctomycetota bacterium]
TIIVSVSKAVCYLSERVTQATLRVNKVFWGLDDQLAFQRHFPAINWLTSYSLYLDVTDPWYDENINQKWSTYRKRAMIILKKEADLQELVRLVGMDSLNANDRLLMEVARMIREDFLNQSAFDDIDTFTSLKKQALMLEVILHFYDVTTKKLEEGYELSSMLDLPVNEDISRSKLLSEQDLDSRFAELRDKVSKALDEAATKAQ